MLRRVPILKDTFVRFLLLFSIVVSTISIHYSTIHTDEDQASVFLREGGTISNPKVSKTSCSLFGK